MDFTTEPLGSRIPTRILGEHNPKILTYSFLLSLQLPSGSRLVLDSHGLRHETGQAHTIHIVGRIMNIRGMMKKSALIAGAAALPGMAMADTVKDTTSNVASAAQIAQVTVTLNAEVGGFLRLEVTQRGATTLTATANPTSSGSTTRQGSVDFGTVDAAGNGGATGVKVAPGGGTDDQFYIAELTAKVFYTGMASVGLMITGAQPTATGAGSPAVAKWACGGNALGNAGWGSVGYGSSLAASPGTTSCFNFTGAGGSTISTAVDLAYYISQATATGTYTTDYTFIATPSVL